MPPRYWFLSTMSIILLAAAAIAGLNVIFDLYGLYRPSHGRHLAVFGDERVAKYLLSLRYVPENFNTLLAGASMSENWDVAAIDKLRIYNESLNGANIVEEKALTEAALGRPGISVVIIIVHPALTYSHDFHTVQMTPDLAHSALGSVSLWDAYKVMANIRLGRLPQTFDSAGTETYLDVPSEMNPYMKQMWSAPDFTVDPAALQAYRDLVANLRARGIRMVFIVPPTSEKLLEVKRVQMDQYMSRMRAETGTGDMWIDFLSPENQAFCNSANFSDGVHLTVPGAKQVVARINESVNRWFEERRLAVAQR